MGSERDRHIQIINVIEFHRLDSHFAKELEERGPGSTFSLRAVISDVRKDMVV